MENKPRISIAKALQVMFRNVPEKQGPPSLSTLKTDAKNVATVIGKKEDSTVIDEVSLLSRRLKKRGMSKNPKQLAYSLLGDVPSSKVSQENKGGLSISRAIRSMIQGY